MADFTSRYVQLNDFILLEYMYTNPTDPEIQSYNFFRIENGHVNDTIQILNVDNATAVTGNVQERSVVQTTGGEYTDLDKDQIPTFLSYDSSLTVSTITATNLKYDKVRFHLVSGYNFEDIDGIIVKITAPERSGNDLTLSALAFLKDGDFFEFNAKPIWLGDRLYDRYFEVLVPSIKLANDTYYYLEGNPSQPSTFVATITSDAGGFLRAAPLHVSVIEIKNTTTLKVGGARYKKYSIGGTKTVALNQSDTFALLSAVIQPSEVGDYFEYYASWNGGFIEDYISIANALPENNYIVLHEIRVAEQVGSSFIETDVLQTIQEADFDKPRKFRPIVDNSDKAVSFTIEYTIRLYNKIDSSQIIRTASYTSYDVKKWGKELQRITILNAPETYKIYNRVVSGPSIVGTSFADTTATVQPFNTKYIPSFFEKNLITLSQDVVFLDSNGQLKTDASTTTKPIYGQGDLNIVLNPFDNFFKFSLLKTENATVPTPLDLGTTAEYYMVFIDDSSKKVRFKHSPDLLIGDPTKGDLVFKIPEASSEKIVKYANKEFYIVSSFSDGATETMMYQGFFNSPSSIQTVKETNSAATSNQNAAIEDRIRQIEVKAEDLQAAANKFKVQTPKQQSIFQASMVEIPGLATDSASSSMTSIIASFVPVVEQGKSEVTKATEAKLSKQVSDKQQNG